MNLYDTLGVAKGASIDVIKRAFRKKAKETHPDSGGDSQAFHAVELAYRVLSDDDKRAEYDATGRVDDGPADTEEAGALTLIAALIERFADDPKAKYRDLAEDMRLSLQADIDAAKHSHEKGEAYIVNLDDLKNRFSGSDFVLRTLDDRKRQAQQALKSIDKQRRIRERALSMLASLTFEAEESADTWFYFSEEEQNHKRDAMAYAMQNARNTFGL